MHLVKLRKGRDMAAEQLRHDVKFKMARVFGRPIKLRMDRQPGWTADLPIYVMYCDRCDLFSISHPAGYGRIHCDKCDDRKRVMTWPRFRDKIFRGYIVPFMVAVALFSVIFLLWKWSHV